MIIRRPPSQGSRLRKSATLRHNCSLDEETFQEVATLAASEGVSFAEKTRQHIEWGLEAIRENAGRTHNAENR